MTTATMTSKGQTTIPKEVRAALGLQAKDALTFTVMHDGSVVMRAKKRMLADLAGIADYSGKVLSLDDMRAWRT